MDVIASSLSQWTRSMHIEGWAFAKYHDCSQFPQVVNFSSVKKLMQMVKINKVSYIT